MACSPLPRLSTILAPGTGRPSLILWIQPRSIKVPPVMVSSSRSIAAHSARIVIWRRQAGGASTPPSAAREPLNHDANIIYFPCLSGIPGPAAVEFMHWTDGNGQAPREVFEYEGR